MSQVKMQGHAESRNEVITRFLARQGLGKAERRPLAGDASFRRYERIHLPDGTTQVLMDAPPEKEDIRPFVKVARFLEAQGYSPPRVLAADETDGLMLLEDLRDDLYSRVLKRSPELEEEMYTAAVEVLADIARRSADAGVPAYDDARLLTETSLFTEWFIPAALPEVSAEARQEFLEIWKVLLPQGRGIPEALALRDYHADNLLWLPERKGAQRVGLLDFQDGVKGPVSYDLVSLLEDARRDVPPALAEKMIGRFVGAVPGLKEDVFRRSYAVLGAQRNFKIVGIFTRLAKRDGKHHYLDYLPRVWAHLEHDLKHSALAPCAAWMDRHVPKAARKAPIL